MVGHHREMLNFFSILLAVLTLVSADFLWWKSKRECRQCVGSQIITFTGPTSEQDAVNFFQSSLGSCASPQEYSTLAPKKSGCTMAGKTEVCTTYEYDLRFWRYCGVGTSVNVNGGAHCFNNICSRTDVRTLTCNDQVKCIFVCPNTCG